VPGKSGKIGVGKSGADTDFSAGSIALGSACAGLFFSGEREHQQRRGQKRLRVGQNLNIYAGQGSLILTPWQTS